jgi:hypothetical protein
MMFEGGSWLDGFFYRRDREIIVLAWPDLAVAGTQRPCCGPTFKFFRQQFYETLDGPVVNAKGQE